MFQSTMGDLIGQHARSTWVELRASFPVPLWSGSVWSTTQR
jgi:hypothetical protein